MSIWLQIKGWIDAKIDDVTEAPDTTYSSEKINTLISDANLFLGTYTTGTRPAALTGDDAGKYIFDSTTKDFVFWTGTAWNDQD